MHTSCETSALDASRMRLGAASVAVALALAAAAADASEPDRGSPEVSAGRASRPSSQIVFFRADALAALGAQRFAAYYGIESGKNFGDKPEPFGIRHRLRAAYGLTEWLKLSVEQTTKHKLDTKELRIGVLAPQLRLSLRGMLGEAANRWPLDVSTYFGPRIRIMGRRDPSVVFGLGSNTFGRRLHFTVNEGLEITVPDPDERTGTNFGPRYDIGVGYELGYGFLVAAEAWGHAVWSRGGYVEQEHHAGPSVSFSYDVARIGLGGGAGFREQPGTSYRRDLRGMLRLGLEI